MDIKRLNERVEHIKNLLDPETTKRQRRLERGKGIAKGLALGTLIGGLAGVFLAPDTGENNRKKAKEELEKAKETLETNLKEGKTKLAELVDENKDIFKDKMIIISDKNKRDEDNFDEEDLEKYEA